MVLGKFKTQINAIARANSGKILKPIGNEKTVKIDPEELEYNNIVGMARNGPMEVTTGDERAALSICTVAKKVRDEIAHLRMPDPGDIMRLIAEMDRLTVLETNGYHNS